MNSTRGSVPLLALGAVAWWGCAHELPRAEASASRAQAAMTPPPGSAIPGDADPGQDPTITDPDKYKLGTENVRVRVLRYHDLPGAKTHRHHHPDSVLHALSAFKRRLWFPDGKSVEREFKPGDVMWVPAQTHIGENIGTTDTEVLLVEVK